MRRPWESFPLMVILGLALGLITGGVPAYSTEVQEAALIAGTTFSLTEIALAGVRPRTEARGVLLAGLMTYGLLGGLVLAFAALSRDPSVRAGWVLMAAVPPAVSVVPITSYLRGDVRRALISEAVLYVLGLGTVPLITFAALGEAVPVPALAVQTALLIGLPLLLSLFLRRWRRVSAERPTAVAVSFAVLVFAIAGSTRAELLAGWALVAGLAFLAFVRTFVLGGGVLWLTRRLGATRDALVGAATFVSFKNLGLTVVLAFGFFGPSATLPAIVALIFEILWMAALPHALARAAPASAAGASGR